MDIFFKQCNSANYTKGRTGLIGYLVVHYTANNGDTALGNINYFTNNKVAASAHYFADEYDTIYQSVKDADTAWHCGANTYKHASCRNNNSIGIEMCSRKDANGVYYIKPETAANAVLLVKELMAKYNIPPENVLRHYDVTGKICPEPFVRDILQWDNFKKAITGKEDVEMVDTTNLKVNGKIYNVNRILKDGSNFIKLSDLGNCGFVIGYDGNIKLPELVSPDKPETTATEIIIDGEKYIVSRILRDGKNYVELQGLTQAGFTVGYNAEDKVPELTSPVN